MYDIDYISKIGESEELNYWFGDLIHRDQKYLIDLLEAGKKMKLVGNHFHSRSTNPRYNKLSYCGSGGMGAVYVLYDTNVSMKRALKIAQPKMSEESEKNYLKRLLLFEQEVGRLSNLEHPGIPQVLDVGFDQTGNPCYIMNLISGDLLDVYMNNRNDYSIADRLNVFIKICDIVQYAHQSGVAHLDLKPDNIIISDYGQVYVIDWGLSKEVNAEEICMADGNLAPRKTSVMGTPEWIAPEQLNGRQVSFSMDLFTLGLLGVYVLTGELPRDIEDGESAIRQLSTQPLTKKTYSLLKTIPTGIRKILMSCLNENPEMRFSSPLILKKELQYWMDYGITKRDKRSLLGYLQYQRISNPRRYFFINYFIVFLLVVGFSFLIGEAMDRKHLADELDEIMSTTNVNDTDSRSQAIQKLELLQSHHTDSITLTSLLDSLKEMK